MSCSNIKFVLKDSDNPNLIKNNVEVFVNGKEKERYAKELFSYFGNNTDSDYILITSFVENKENRVVKKNQVAEKIDYKLTAEYIVFYRNQDCKIFNKQIVTKFSFVPKSFGYNFGTDRSLDKLYTRSVRKNIKSFIDLIPEGKTCL